jgi:hypothetical protein
MMPQAWISLAAAVALGRVESTLDEGLGSESTGAYMHPCIAPQAPNVETAPLSSFGPSLMHWLQIKCQFATLK